jgi:putrescine---pyruvate transaminase
MVGDRVAEALTERGGEFHHGFTYSGHPAACAASCAAITLLKEEQIVERVRDDVGPYLQQRWRELAEHPLVGETRMVGLIGALELVKDKATRTFFSEPGQVGTLCRDLCVQNGLVMRAVRDTMIIAPPLVITREQIDELIDKARASLDMTLAALAKQAPG